MLVLISIIIFLCLWSAWGTFFIATLIVICIHSLFINKDSKIYYLVGLILTIFLVFMGSFLAGRTLAEDTEVHLMAVYDDKTYIVLTEYKEHYVIAPVDLSRNEMDPVFQLIPLSNQGFEVYFEEITNLEITSY